MKKKKQHPAPIMAMTPYEAKPFSAHLHAEGRTMDELHANIRSLMNKHLKPPAKGKSRKRGRPGSVAKALST